MLTTFFLALGFASGVSSARGSRSLKAVVSRGALSPRDAYRRKMAARALMQEELERSAAAAAAAAEPKKKRTPPVMAMLVLPTSEIRRRIREASRSNTK